MNKWLPVNCKLFGQQHLSSEVYNFISKPLLLLKHIHVNKVKIQNESNIAMPFWPYYLGLLTWRHTTRPVRWGYPRCGGRRDLRHQWCWCTPAVAGSLSLLSGTAGHTSLTSGGSAADIYIGLHWTPFHWWHYGGNSLAIRQGQKVSMLSKINLVTKTPDEVNITNIIIYIHCTKEIMFLFLKKITVLSNKGQNIMELSK